MPVYRQEQVERLKRFFDNTHMETGALSQSLRRLPSKVVLMSGCTGTGLFELVAKELFEKISALTGKKFEAAWRLLSL